VIIVALVERGKPDISADQEDRDTVDEEQPVEHDERFRSPYGDENKRTNKSCEEDDPQNGPTSEINGPKSEVEKQVGLAPDERKSESDDSCGQEASIEESPGKHEMLGHHLGRVMVGVREALSRRLLQDDVLPENVEC